MAALKGTDSVNLPAKQTLRGLTPPANSFFGESIMTDEEIANSPGCAIFAFVAITAIGCSIAINIYGQRQEEQEFRNVSYTIPIERVFMHQIGDYTVFVKEGSRLVPKSLWNRCERRFGSQITLVADVPVGEPMYLVRKDGNYYIHIHSADEVNGGEWNKGKFGKGTTTVVE